MRTPRLFLVASLLTGAFFGPMAQAAEPKTKQVATQLRTKFAQKSYGAYIQMLAALKSQELSNLFSEQDTIEALVALRRAKVPEAQQKAILAKLTASYPHTPFLWKCLNGDASAFLKDKWPENLSFETGLKMRRTLLRLGEEQASAIFGVALSYEGFKIGTYHFEVDDVKVISHLSATDADAFLSKARKIGGKQAIQTISLSCLTFTYPVPDEAKPLKHEKDAIKAILTSLPAGEMWDTPGWVEELYAAGKKEDAFELFTLVSKNHKSNYQTQLAMFWRLAMTLDTEATLLFLDRCKEFLAPETVEKLRQELQL